MYVHCSCGCEWGWNVKPFTDHEWDLIAYSLRAEIDNWQRMVDALPTETSMRRLRELNALLTKIRGESK